VHWQQKNDWLLSLLVNMAISKHWTTWVLVLLHLIGFQSALICAEKNNPSFFVSIPDNAGEDHCRWLVADFDGDHISDLAVARSEASFIRVEIHLSTEPHETSIHHSSAEPGIRLFVYDVDRDNDQDLIFASPASLSPPAVWLNDGKGHFEQSEGSDGFSLVCEDPLTLETESSQAEPVLIAQDDDRPLDKSCVLRATVTLDVTNLLSPRWRGFAIEVRTFYLPPRSPPPILLS
jgi:hypothetical protein